MTKPRSRAEQAKFRRETFDLHKQIDAGGHVHLECYVCGIRINPAREDWEADHVVRRVVGGSRDAKTNGSPICIPCHRPKTAKDHIENAKGKRVADKTYGIKKGPKRGRSMPGSRDSPYKRKMDGTVVRRDKS